MCEKVVENHYPLKFAPDQYKAQWMCERAIEKDSCNLNFKTKKMCEGVVKKYPCALQFVLYWFVTREWLLMWYDDDEDKFFGWYDGYQKRRSQKAQIKKELIPIAWHPSRYWDWCMSEDEKKETEKLWA